MGTQKFKIIEGGRDKLEDNLAKALFGDNDLEIEKQIALLNSIEIKKPELILINHTK